MSDLIDTVSELVRPKPAAAVPDWFANTPDEALFLSALTLGEIRKGVEKLADTQRREKLRLWLEHDLRDWFARGRAPRHHQHAYCHERLET